MNQRTPAMARHELYEIRRLWKTILPSEPIALCDDMLRTWSASADGARYLRALLEQWRVAEAMMRRERYSDACDHGHAGNRQRVEQEMRKCCECVHWRADTINPEGGLGTCTANAPASRKVFVYPWAVVQCKLWHAVPSETQVGGETAVT